MEKWVGERILTSLEDPKLLGPWFGKPRDGSADTWSGWKTIVKGTFALGMNDQEKETFLELSGRTEVPKEPCSELTIVAGRRSGKTRFLAALTTIMSLVVDYSPYQSLGETFRVMLLSYTSDQAKFAFGYIRSFIENVPVFWKYVDVNTKGQPAITEHTVKLIPNIEVTVQAASFRSIRGPTVPVAINDEIAYWRVEGSANPDSEIIEALRPSMATVPNSFLMKCSSPFERKGLLWKEYKTHFGADQSDTIVVQAPSWKLNPTLPDSFFTKEYQRDPEFFQTEYAAQFRSGVTRPLSPEVVESAVVPGLYELEPQPDKDYIAFVDSSGGSQDSFTLAIAHWDDEKETRVLDMLREVSPPFNPEDVVEQYANELGRYGLDYVIGDRYSGEWVASAFARYGIDYEVSKLSKSDLYHEMVPVFNTQSVELLDNHTLKDQLVSLERKSGGAGKDRIDHPPKGKDDLANVVAGCLVNLEQHSESPINLFVFND